MRFAALLLPSLGAFHCGGAAALPAPPRLFGRGSGGGVMLGRGPGGASLLPLTLLVNRGIILQASAVCEDTQHYSYSPWLPFIGLL